MRTLFLLTLMLGAFLYSKTSHAGLVVSWVMPSKKIHFTVEYENPEKIRMSIEENLYLLVTASNIYVVNEDSVTDVFAFRDKIKDWAIVRYLSEKMLARAKKVPTPGSLKSLGKSERVAGIEGEVYQAEIFDPDTGQKEQREYVLTKDKRLVELKHALQAVSDQNMKTFHNEGFNQMRNSFNQTFPTDVFVLRYANKFYIESVSERALAPERFSLPAGAEIKDLPSLSDLGTFIRLATPLAYSN